MNKIDKPPLKVPPLKVNGITEQDFINWRLNPVTKAVNKFLQDYAKELVVAHGERWLEGPTDDDYEAETRGRVLTHKELATLQFRHILTFYTEPEDEESDERQPDTD